MNPTSRRWSYLTPPKEQPSRRTPHWQRPKAQQPEPVSQHQAGASPSGGALEGRLVRRSHDARVVAGPASTGEVSGVGLVDAAAGLGWSQSATTTRLPDATGAEPVAGLAVLVDEPTVQRSWHKEQLPQLNRT